MEEYLYHETNNTGKCALDLQFRCSQDNLLLLEQNITKHTASIGHLIEERGVVRDKINKDLH